MVAEYWISHIKRKQGEITQVNAFLNTVEGLKNPNIFDKKEIINSIDNNEDKWYTCVLQKQNSGKRLWEKGSKLHVIKRNNQEYIRTNPDLTKKDNLDRLPSIDKTTEHTFQRN
ncbi:MAG: DUF3892 domain-containing protein [Candidatus Thermoplasmatota archaeon]|nr:DUF3892 domain-containing protein [Candidatus Thermoplasmatota archaeon]